MQGGDVFYGGNKSQAILLCGICTALAAAAAAAPPGSAAWTDLSSSEGSLLAAGGKKARTPTGGSRRAPPYIPEQKPRCRHNLRIKSVLLKPWGGAADAADTVLCQRSPKISDRAMCYTPFLTNGALLLPCYSSLVLHVLQLWVNPYVWVLCGQQLGVEPWTLHLTFIFNKEAKVARVQEAMMWKVRAASAASCFLSRLVRHRTCRRRSPRSNHEPSPLSCTSLGTGPPVVCCQVGDLRFASCRRPGESHLQGHLCAVVQILDPTPCRASRRGLPGGAPATSASWPWTSCSPRWVRKPFFYFPLATIQRSSPSQSASHHGSVWVVGVAVAHAILDDSGAALPQGRRKCEKKLVLQHPLAWRVHHPVPRRGWLLNASADPQDNSFAVASAPPACTCRLPACSKVQWGPIVWRH